MRCLRDLAALEALRPAWAALWARVPDATPFQHPAWLIPWWRHVGEGALLSFALEEDGALLAFFPFYVWQRRLFPLGIGTTDYLDALVAPGSSDDAMAALMPALAAHRDLFDIAEWPQLRPATPLLRGVAPAGWRDAVEEAEPCPVLALPATAEGLRERVSAKTLRDLRTARKRADARFEVATAETLGELGEALLALHAARWQARDEAGVLAGEGVQRMHREAMPALQEAGLLRLFGLRVASAGRSVGPPPQPSPAPRGRESWRSDDPSPAERGRVAAQRPGGGATDPAGQDARPIAVIHALADPPGRADRRLYLYLQGFDPALERLSPGLLLLGDVIEHAIAEGFASADFLRGQERYKSFWGATNAPTFRRTLTPPESPA